MFAHAEVCSPRSTSRHSCDRMEISRLIDSRLTTNGYSADHSSPQVERLDIHGGKTLEQESSAKGPTADLISQVSFGFGHADLSQCLHQISIAHASSLHFRAQHALCLGLPIHHARTIYDAFTIKYDAKGLAIQSMSLYLMRM
jgi:hypothetical protein